MVYQKMLHSHNDVYPQNNVVVIDRQFNQQSDRHNYPNAAQTYRNNEQIYNYKNDYKKAVKPDENESCDCCCWCYNKSSTDSRCCGACYCCCPVKDNEDPFMLCPNGFSEYWDSCYVQTVSGYGGKQKAIEEKNGCFTCVCFPIKFTLFFPCFLGSLFNECINCMRYTDTNYLF